MLTESEFVEKYYYKNDLILLCKKMGLSHSGTKYELQNRILGYIKSGKKNTYTTTICKGPLCPDELTLTMGFIENGLKFDKKLRDYISKQTGKVKITFTKHMGHAVRNAKHEGIDITIKELIDIYNTPKSSLGKLPEDKTYQWNNFVKGFSQSDESLKYNEKLKVASILWNKVRDSNNEKIFKKELIIQYGDLLLSYLKKDLCEKSY
jgi:hypothetical protein